MSGYLECQVCKGRKVIELFTSSSPCDACKGTGRADIAHLGVDRATLDKFDAGGFTVNYGGVDQTHRGNSIQQFINSKLGANFLLHVEIDPPQVEDSLLGLVSAPPCMKKSMSVRDAESFIRAFDGYKQFLWCSSTCNLAYAINRGELDAVADGSFEIEGMLFADRLRARVLVHGFGDCQAVQDCLEKFLENPRT